MALRGNGCSVFFDGEGGPRGTQSKASSAVLPARRLECSLLFPMAQSNTLIAKLLKAEEEAEKIVPS